MNADKTEALSHRIEELKRKKKAVILAHYYTCLLYTSDAADESGTV